jgi:hypothetical protein
MCIGKEQTKVRINKYIKTIDASLYQATAKRVNPETIKQKVNN